jgi:hypothetical protein
LEESASLLQSEQLKSKRLEEDLQILNITSIKLTGKMQLESEELAQELERQKTLKASDVSKVKRELTVRFENAEKALKSEQARHNELVKELKDKHNREIGLM